MLMLQCQVGMKLKKQGVAIALLCRSSNLPVSEELMRESVTYQAIQNEGLQQGLEQERSLVFKLLTR
jgi:hypothetical protein